jgi:hypothetical protein
VQPDNTAYARLDPPALGEILEVIRQADREPTSIPLTAADHLDGAQATGRGQDELYPVCFGMSLTGGK